MHTPYRQYRFLYFTRRCAPCTCTSFAENRHFTCMSCAPLVPLGGCCSSGALHTETGAADVRHCMHVQCSTATCPARHHTHCMHVQCSTATCPARHHTHTVFTYSVQLRLAQRAITHTLYARTVFNCDLPSAPSQTHAIQ